MTIFDRLARMFGQTPAGQRPRRRRPQARPRPGYHGGGNRGGFRFVGPFPGYSTTTRRGNRVHVGGCCLPIPLSVFAAGTTALVVRRRTARR